MATARTLPTPEQMKLGAEPAVANAARLLGAAELLASAGTFGLATSAAVLAWEEAVKARLLMGKVLADAFNRPFAVSDTDLHKLLNRSHTGRHSMGFVQSLPTADRVAILYGFGTIQPDRAVQLQGELEDARAANDQKQRGMYVDFDAETNTWHTPEEITEDVCRDRIEHVRRFLEETQRQLRDLAML